MLDVEFSDFLIHAITLYARQPRVQAIRACNQTTSRGSINPRYTTKPSKIRDVNFIGAAERAQSALSGRVRKAIVKRQQWRLLDG